MAKRAIYSERLAQDVRTRFTPSQKSRLLAAATKLGKTPADFLREAGMQRAEQVLSQGQDAREALADLVGLVDLPGSFSQDTGSRLAEQLLAKHTGKKRRILK